MDWMIECIARKIGERVGSVIEIDKYSMCSGSMRALQIQVNFNLNSAFISTVWIPFMISYG